VYHVLLCVVILVPGTYTIERLCIEYGEEKGQQKHRTSGRKCESRKAGASGGRAGGGSEEVERKGPSRGEKGASKKEKQEEKETLLRVQTQAGTIQPLSMGRTHAA